MKIVFCLRNPVERAFSGWTMRRNNGTEDLPFREALQANLKQREEIKFLTEEDAKIWFNDQRRGNRQDDSGYRTYVEGSLYAYNLSKYLEHFDMSQIKIVYMEGLKKNLLGTLKEIYTFLGVDPDYVIEKTEQKNTYKKSKIGFLEPILGKNKKLSKMIGNLVPKGFKQKMLDTMYVEGSKELISPEDKKFAYDIFKDEVTGLEKLLNKDFSHWKLS